MSHVRLLLRRPMGEDEFWRLVDVLEGSSDEDAVARLVEALRAQGRRRAVAFAERLAVVLHDLDREVLATRPVRWSDDDEDDDPIPLSDDSFLYLRADVVAHGREMVAAVLADPDVLLEHRWDDGEALLYAADEAAGREIETRVSYETGSNAAHWSARYEADDVPFVPPVVALSVADLSQPVEVETHGADGSHRQEVTYLPPDWLHRRTEAAVQTGLGEAVGDVAVLPEDSADAWLEVRLGLGTRWDLTPRVEPGAAQEWGEGTVTRVQVELPGDEVAALPRADQTTLLLSAAATCVLAVLPPDHGARPRLQDVAAAGRPLLPGS
ncbi:DUF4240 domain-containing protein [Cellulomonas sp. JZ18]|uniref:DUF4240 domain-containing protein n=1 Tax=Cellulomonas sp. JZ18 TaxID=2654191 RepID=UPI0012D49D0E|nr:DUF4240 domain-containing protein [Cellulomonas sp. JZ18]QGQ20687.1 DUF4240 domain-containing protein [Cellulomonas sp. JZ18]